MPFNISVSPARNIISPDEINSHFTNDKNLRWVKLKDLLGNVAEQCVDGRSEKGIIGTPGGNMGEFILALDAAEKVTSIILREKEIEDLFAHYLENFGSFYMHTDTHGLHHLLEDKSIQKLHLHSKKDIENFIINPPKEIQTKLLKLLTDPANIGCGHLKLMLLHQEEYGVRSELIQTAMGAFYKALWKQTKNLEFIILDADHAEGAVTTVLVEDKAIKPDTEIPTVSSMGKDHQMFVNHPQAITFLREQIAIEIITKKLIYGLTKKLSKKYLQTIVDRGNHFTRLTLSYLALGLPHYTVTVSK